ncbi:unnamed protein product, partial [Mesorhabditis spiculigera]
MRVADALLLGSVTLLIACTNGSPAPQSPEKPQALPAKCLGLLDRPSVFIHEAVKSDVVTWGDAYTLHCEATASPPSGITWYKDGQKISKDLKIETMEGIIETGVETREGRLHIPCFSPSMEGEYTCVVDNECGVIASSSTNITLNGMARPKRCLKDISPPVIVEATTSRVEQPQNNVRMICRAAGLPKPTIYWTRIDEDGNDISIENDVRFQREATGDLVVLGQLNSDEASIDLRCTAQNEWGEAFTESSIIYVLPENSPYTLFAQHEALHHQAEKEFLRQQKQFQDQLLLHPFQQTFVGTGGGGGPPLFAPPTNNYYEQPQTAYRPQAVPQINRVSTQPLPVATRDIQGQQVVVSQPAPLPVQQQKIAAPAPIVASPTRVQTAGVESAERILPRPEHMKAPTLDRITSSKEDPPFDPIQNAMVAQVLQVNSDGIDRLHESKPNHARRRSKSGTRSEGKANDKSAETVIRGERTFTASESHDEDTLEVNTKDVPTAKKEGNVDIQKLFHALDLSPDEKREIVQHVEQLLKEEITRKILRNAGFNLNSTTSLVPSWPRETTITQLSTTTMTTTFATTPFPATTRPSITLHGTVEEVPEPSPIKHMSGTLHIRDQPEIRESQPAPPRMSLIDETSVAESKSPIVQPGQTIKIIGAEQIQPQGDPDWPVQTTDKHLSFNGNPRTVEEGIGRIHTRRIRPEADTLLPDAVDPEVTGEPLDLSEADSVTPAGERMVVNVEPVTTTTEMTTTTDYQPLSKTNYLPPRMRNRPHVMTAFQRLANDYRARLEGTDSMGRLLANFYKDAYIVLRQRDVSSSIKRHPTSRNKNRHRKVFRGRV